MNWIRYVLLAGLLGGQGAVAQPGNEMTSAEEAVAEAIIAVLGGDHRDPANVTRDAARHPLETLLFFGWRPEMTVVEVWPSGGWYTEILAPITRPAGQYYAAGFSFVAQRTPEWRKEVQRAFEAKLKARPDVYDHVIVTDLSVPERTAIAPPGSADLVLTFRNVHNWMNGDYAGEMFEVMARALKPGGVLGLVEHRAPNDFPPEKLERSGYVTEAQVIAFAAAAGLKLEARSDINANPADSHDHPAGVWSLPPTLRYCRSLEPGLEQARCVEKYLAIGESDRMTLRFIKPPAG